MKIRRMDKKKKMPEKTTTVSINKVTMKQLKQRALNVDMNYKAYLECCISHSWYMQDQDVQSWSKFVSLSVDQLDIFDNQSSVSGEL